jgi:hypothetical protein
VTARDLLELLDELGVEFPFVRAHVEIDLYPRGDRDDVRVSLDLPVGLADNDKVAAFIAKVQA